MDTFLKECESRLAEAKKVFQEAQQRSLLAQQAFIAAQAELNLWTGAVNAETLRLQKEKPQTEPEKPTSPAPSSGQVLQSVGESANNPTAPPDLNKTEMIRDILRRNPSGMTPAEVWKGLNRQVDRAYVYSVLKRLKDRDQVSYRRKKYSLKAGLAPKAEHGHAPATLQ
jgi:hypothetical protein